MPSLPEDVKHAGVTLHGCADGQMPGGERNGPKILDMELSTMKCWFVLSSHENAFIFVRCEMTLQSTCIAWPQFSFGAKDSQNIGIGKM